MLPVLYFKVSVVLAEELDSLLSLDDLPELGLVCLGDCRKTCTLVYLVEVLESLARIAILVVRLCKVEVCLSKTEEREFEPGP